MAKSRKSTISPQPPALPQVGDKVIPERSEAVYVITKVRTGNKYVDLELPGTNLDRFHVDVATLKFVHRAPRPTPPADSPTLDAAKVAERLSVVRDESLQRLDDDIAILSKYLKTEGAPKDANNALEELSNEQRESWDKAIQYITELIEE